MSDSTSNKNKKKKRSQAPVALVYFATMLLFLAVFGLLATKLVSSIISQEEQSEPDPVEAAPVYNTMYVRVNGDGVLQDICIVRISSEKKQIAVTPVSAYTVSDSDRTSTFREVYDDGGIRRLKSAVEETFDITADYYITVGDSAFESVADILGGIIYTPGEELYYLSSESDDNDILYKANQASSIAGKQIRLICEYPVFSEGFGGNQKFLGEAVGQMINNAFQQVNITKNNLDNIYSIMTSHPDNNYTATEFREHKSYISSMLSESIPPVTVLTPAGEWTDKEHFSVSESFKTDLKKTYESTAANPVIAAGDTAR